MRRSMRERGATCDCYGTLIDWNGGIRAELGRLFGEDHAGRLLARYHEVEPRVQEERSDASYRDVLAAVLAELARGEGVELPADDHDALGRSLPRWPPFQEVRDALSGVRERGWRLVILSNTDRDFIEASMERIGVPFELAIVASEIGSYKPAHRHWEEFWKRTRADRARHVHVGASLFHDMEPAHALRLPAVWINRLGEEATVEVARELPDLVHLAEALDELVAA